MSPPSAVPAGARTPLPTVLLVGAGGIGNPAALVLAETGRVRLLIADDDEIEASNLHRQIVYTDTDIGRPKTGALLEALARRSPGLSLAETGRALPETIAALLPAIAVVLDGTDNFATRFLLADACALAGKPVVHAAAVRWSGTVTVVGGAARPCYRCFFEDLPSGDVPDCASAGVVGPLCGVVGGVAADEVLRLLAGDQSGVGTITRFDAKTGRFRRTSFTARRACPLCGDRPAIRDLARDRYLAPACAS